MITFKEWNEMIHADLPELGMTGGPPAIVDLEDRVEELEERVVELEKMAGLPAKRPMRVLKAS